MHTCRHHRQQVFDSSNGASPNATLLVVGNNAVASPSQASVTIYRHTSVNGSRVVDALYSKRLVDPATRNEDVDAVVAPIRFVPLLRM